MAGLNKVMLIGCLGRDPELHYTPDGIPVTSFSLAVRGVGENNTEGSSVVEWVNIVAWRRLAEVCNQTLHKDKRVYIEGRIHTRGWKDEEGERHFRTEVIATDLIPLDSSVVKGPEMS